MRFFKLNRSKTELQDFRAARSGGREGLYAVEALEPRILLSAAPVFVPEVGSDTTATEQSDAPEQANSASQEQVQWDESTQGQQSIPVQATADSEFIFGETEALAPLENEQQAAPLIDAVEEPSAPIAPPVDTILPEADEDETTPVSATTEVNEAAPLVGDSTEFNSDIVANDGSNILPPAPDLNTNPILDQLTETLNAANAPPVTNADLQDVTSNETPPPSGDGSLLSGDNTENTASSLLDSSSRYLGYAAQRSNDGGLTLFASGDIDLRNLDPEFLQQHGITSLTIQGGALTNDTLFVDLSFGDIPMHITFHGGDGGYDTLSLRGVNGGNYTPGKVFGDGVFTSSATNITFTGLEPVIVDGTGDADGTFTFTTSSTGGGQDMWDPLESTCRHASLSIL